MKKRFATIGLVLALSTAVLAGCSQKTEATAAEGTTVGTTAAGTTETTATDAARVEGEYQFAAPADAVAAAKDKSAIVLDVREWDNYVKGRVADSQWCPIFPLEDDSLVENMKAYAKQKLSDGSKIYIICNSGNKGAQKTTEVLKDAGIDEALIYTVEGGAKALASEKGALITNRADEDIAWKFVSGAEAVKAVGNADIQILDVRDNDTYAAGRLEGSLQCSLKEIEDSAAQTEMYQMAKEQMDSSKPVYLLCYSGNKCAKTGISVLKDAGFDVDNLFIIENGAKDADVQAALVK